MSVKFVVFEDHSWANFRPVCLSIPSYELRMGMFNTRERAELVSEDAGFDGRCGTLLCREILAPLHTCDNWAINPESLIENSTDKSKDNSRRYFWLNGRSRTSFSALTKMLSSFDSNLGQVVVDKHGLVAAFLNEEDSLILHENWIQWQIQAQNQRDNQRQSPPSDLSWNPLPSVNLSTVEIPELKALQYIWDLVPATSEILDDDLNFVSTGKPYSRQPFGVFGEISEEPPFWTHPSILTEACNLPQYKDLLENDGAGVWLGKNVKLARSIDFDTSKGPIILDNSVEVMPHCFLEGPLYAGSHSRFKAGSTIYGESSFGLGNRLSGEIGESTFGDFANKQHDGFIGHAVLGSWTNLGAMTTCSDLKNNYGNVRVDLGSGLIDTRLRFVGLLMGDHVKTAIGSLFNTGTCVGFASNIFGGGMPPKLVGNYSWGGSSDSPVYDVEKALETAEVVMARRGCRMVEEAKILMRWLS